MVGKIEVYFACALGEARKDQTVASFYEAVRRMFAQVGDIEFYMPHLDTLPEGEDVWQHAMERVRQSDLLVLYAGVESLGAGQEFAYANNVAQTPTVVVIEWDKSLDPAIEGAATRVIRFRGVQDLEDQLIPTIHELVN